MALFKINYSYNTVDEDNNPIVASVGGAIVAQEDVDAIIAEHGEKEGFQIETQEFIPNSANETQENNPIDEAV